MKNCRCNHFVLTTPFCPHCGRKKPEGKQRRYRIDGRTMVKPILAVRTNSFRCPMKGELYLSGAIPMAYIAFNNISSKFWIAKGV